MTTRSQASSNSNFGGVGEADARQPSNTTNKRRSGKDDAHIRHPVSDDLFSELGALVVRVEGCILSLVCCCATRMPNSLKYCFSPSCGIFSLRAGRLIQSLMRILFSGIQAKHTFNRHSHRVAHNKNVRQWEPDSELQKEPSGWEEDGLDI